MKLTVRQTEVLNLVADGLKVNEIAEKLGLHARSVRNHKTEIMVNLGAVNSPHAVKIAYQEGILPISLTND